MDYSRCHYQIVNAFISKVGDQLSEVLNERGIQEKKKKTEFR